MNRRTIGCLVGKRPLFAAVAIAVSISSTAILRAEIRLPGIFSNGMVVQQSTKAPIWGWADPNEVVEIRASWGAKARTKADENGNWTTKIKTPKAGGPFQIDVNDTTIENVLAGEVWFCSGQSNMDCKMKFFTQKAKDSRHQPAVEAIRHEIDNAEDPLLRQIAVDRTPSFSEKKDGFKSGWIESAPESNSEFTATGYFFGRELRRELDVPVGLINCAWGGTRVQPWIPESGYRSDPEMEAYYEAEKTKFESREKIGRQSPTALYNGMVAPVVPYAVKGVIWYQGESNAKYMTEVYEQHFRALVKSWRKEWDQDAFPFYWAQLASFLSPDYDSKENKRWDPAKWVSICDQQRRALDLPNTGMAVLNDIGEADDIHPRNKIDVGRRLALWALAKDYGLDIPVYSGPLYRKHKIGNGKVAIKFDHAGSGLMTGEKNVLEPTVEVDEPLQYFEIKSDGGSWMPAEARIASKDTVEVWHPDVAEPAAVRYAWAANPEGANLYNREGLPASLFTTCPETE